MKTYSKGDIYDKGTRVKAKDDSEYAHWNKYPMSVVSFVWREDGGISYYVRAWRTNQHLIPEEQLEKLADADYCSRCMSLMSKPKCDCGCHCG